MPPAWLDPRLANADYLRIVGAGIKLRLAQASRAAAPPPLPPRLATLQASQPWDVRVGMVTIHVVYDDLGRGDEADILL